MNTSTYEQPYLIRESEHEKEDSSEGHLKALLRSLEMGPLLYLFPPQSLVSLIPVTNRLPALLSNFQPTFRFF